MIYSNNLNSITESVQEFGLLSEGLTSIVDIGEVHDKIQNELKSLFKNIFDVIGEMDYKKSAFNAGSIDTVKDTAYFERSVKKINEKINGDKLPSSITINFPDLDKSITPTKFAKEIAGSFNKSGFEQTKYRGLLKKMFKTNSNVYYKKINDNSIIVAYAKPYHNSTYDTYSGQSTIGLVTGLNIKFKFVENDSKFEKEFKLESAEIYSDSIFGQIQFK